ncbi:MAG: alpha/beta hydrolase [Candidatus Binatia bacterium]
MLTKAEVRIDVTERVGSGARLEMAATVVAATRPLPHPSIVCFAFPGGGYNRRYFDLQFSGRPRYSQAEHHAEQGLVFVACDHLAVGESSVPETPLDEGQVVVANVALVDGVLARLAAGAIDGIPPLPAPVTIGMGQSYGGLLLILQQAAHRVFDGVAMLGWSAIRTVVPVADGRDVSIAFGEVPTSGLEHPFRHAFHFTDVDEALVEEDLRGWPYRMGTPVPRWAATSLPGGPHAAIRDPVALHTVAAEAAAIDVPVFIGNGEIDVCPDPRAEPGAYARSPDITTFILPRSAHMHNFAGTRKLLWDRLAAWAQGVAATYRVRK